MVVVVVDFVDVVVGVDVEVDDEEKTSVVGGGRGVILGMTKSSYNPLGLGLSSSLPSNDDRPIPISLPSLALSSPTSPPTSLFIPLCPLINVERGVGLDGIG